MASTLWGLLALAATLALAALWRRRGWGDAARGAERARKLQAGAVPAVGGLAIAITWCLQAGFGPLTSPEAAPFLVAALFVAFGSGALDDALPGGLRPRPKLGFQLLAGACLGARHLFPEGLGGAPELGASAWQGAASTLLLAPVFANAINTFDNADGAVGAVAGAGLLRAGSPWAPALLGFLVPNLFLRRGASGGPSPMRDADPVAYLGDGGSQLVALVLLADDASWGALVLPLADLLRVALLRLRRGARPWVGDRRHLAHRLQRRGLGPLAVASCLLGIAAPSLLLGLGLEGVVATLGLYALTLALTAGNERRVGPDAS